MAKIPPPYARLTRANPGIGSYSSLWLASDHLMLVVSTGYHEGYQRFLLRDIKGFFITRSRQALITASIAGACAIPLGIVGGIDWAGSGTGVVWIIFAMIAAVIGLVSWFFLRNCRVHLVTGVQTVELRPLHRTRRTRRVLAKLKPLIEAAQADLAVEAPAVPVMPPPLPEPPQIPPLPNMP